MINNEHDKVEMQAITQALVLISPETAQAVVRKFADKEFVNTRPGEQLVFTIKTLKEKGLDEAGVLAFLDEVVTARLEK